MPDLYWRSTAGESAGRLLRERYADLANFVDRRRRGPAAGTRRRLVQIYDGGSIPTGGDKFYLTHPVELGGTEAEGGVYTVSVDTTQTIPVVILGDAVIAGDLVVAYAIGGRWVAERREAGEHFIACDDCNIPD